MTLGTTHLAFLLLLMFALFVFGVVVANRTKSLNDAGGLIIMAGGAVFLSLITILLYLS
jgi:hypothetical protein